MIDLNDRATLETIADDIAESNSIKAMMLLIKKLAEKSGSRFAFCMKLQETLSHLERDIPGVHKR